MPTDPKHPKFSDIPIRVDSTMPKDEIRFERTPTDSRPWRDTLKQVHALLNKESIGKLNDGHHDTHAEGWVWWMGERCRVLGLVEALLAVSVEPSEDAHDTHNVRTVTWLRGIGYYEAANAIAEMHVEDRALRGLEGLVFHEDIPAAVSVEEPQEAKVCVWTEDMDGEMWESACGESWVFIDGGPQENKARFCHGCGKPVKAVPYLDTIVDEDEPAPAAEIPRKKFADLRAEMPAESQARAEARTQENKS